MARTHASYDPRVRDQVDYQCGLIEDFGQDDEGTDSRFDVVCALEVVEHTADHLLFLQHCARLLRPNG